MLADKAILRCVLAVANSAKDDDTWATWGEARGDIPASKCALYGETINALLAPFAGDIKGARFSKAFMSEWKLSHGKAGKAAKKDKAVVEADNKKDREEKRALAKEAAAAKKEAARLAAIKVEGGVYAVRVAGEGADRFADIAATSTPTHYKVLWFVKQAARESYAVLSKANKNDVLEATGGRDIVVPSPQHPVLVEKAEWEGMNTVRVKGRIQFHEVIRSFVAPL